MLDRFVGGGVFDAVSAVGVALDELVTSDEERMQNQAVLERLRQQPHILQAEINKLEAQHRTIFVAGWRPYIGWVCGFGLTWNFILEPIMKWIAVLYGFPLENLPQFSSLDQLIALVISMLGLGGLRTYEKFKGVTR
jgi:hypothetical protein